MNFKFEKLEDEVCMYKRLYTGVGSWSTYDGSDHYNILNEDCILDSTLFPCNTPKSTDILSIEAMDKNIRSCANRIKGLGLSNEIPNLFKALDDIRNPSTFDFNWRTEKYLLDIPEQEYFTDNDIESVESFNKSRQLDVNMNFTVNKYITIFIYNRYVIALSDLPDELFFVGQIKEVRGRRPDRMLKLAWLDHGRSSKILFGNGSWELNGII